MSNPLTTAQLADSPLCLWELGEASGATTAVNQGSTGAAFNGTIGANVTMGAAGCISGTTAAQITSNFGNPPPGADAYMVTTPRDTGNAHGLQPTGDYSIEFVIKPTPSDSDTSIISYGSSGESSAEPPWFVYLNTSFFLSFSSDCAGTPILGSTYASQDNVAYHCVVRFTHASGTVEIFVDGASKGSQTGFASPIYNDTGNTYGFMLGGGWQTSPGTTDALLQNVAFYGSALTNTQITNHYNATGFGGGGGAGHRRDVHRWDY